MGTPEIALYSETSKADPKDLAFYAEAISIQLKRDVAPLWERDPWICTFFDKPPSTSDAYPMAVKEVVPEGEEGDHGDYANGPVATVLLDAGLSVTSSHEGVEMFGDSECNIWKPYKPGVQVAQELGDPVEAQTYNIDVELLGEKRSITVSNFVLPDYFVEGSFGPWDFLKQLPGPLSIAPGGYLILLNDDGTYSNQFGKGTTSEQRGKLYSKFLRKHSRSYRRMHSISTAV